MIGEEYNKIISECKFISKKDCWFVESLEAKCDGNYNQYKESDKFNNGWSVFHGFTLEGSKDGNPIEDGESCNFDEFYIFDKFGNEISELTLIEYTSLLRDQRINSILDI